jgi:hypothetical protein
MQEQGKMKEVKAASSRILSGLAQQDASDSHS